MRRTFTLRALLLGLAGALFVCAYAYFNEGTTTVVPALGEILIDETQYTNWVTGTPAYVCNNVGRRPADLAIQLLPDWLVMNHCQDLSQQKSHLDSRVYKSFEFYYTLVELEAKTLWTRLDQQALNGGFCVP